MEMFRCRNCKEVKSRISCIVKYKQIEYCCEYCWDTYREAHEGNI